MSRLVPQMTARNIELYTVLNSRYTDYLDKIAPKRNKILHYSVLPVTMDREALLVLEDLRADRAFLNVLNRRETVKYLIRMGILPNEKWYKKLCWILSINRSKVSVAHWILKYIARTWRTLQGLQTVLGLSLELK